MPKTKSATTEQLQGPKQDQSIQPVQEIKNEIFALMKQE